MNHIHMIHHTTYTPYDLHTSRTSHMDPGVLLLLGATLMIRVFRSLVVGRIKSIISTQGEVSTEGDVLVIRDREDAILSLVVAVIILMLLEMLLVVNILVLLKSV